MDYQHRSGTLKQKNKRHKVGKHDSKSTLNKMSGGKVERVSVKRTTSSTTNSKMARQLRTKQLRDQKKNEIWLRKRIGSLRGPPKIVGLISLSEGADINQAMENFTSADNSLKFCSGVAGAQNFVSFTSQKQRFSFCKSNGTLLSALDVAKVADIIVYVVAMNETLDDTISEAGDNIIVAVRSQGCPSIMGLLQVHQSASKKRQADFKRYARRFFDTEFGSDVKIAECGRDVKMLRALCTTSLKCIAWRDMRSYMLVDNADFLEDGMSTTEGTLKISGYVRGKPLNANQLIHISNFGTFQMSKICACAEPGQSTNSLNQSLSEANPQKQQSLEYEAEVDPFCAEQTWPTEEELEEAKMSVPSKNHSVSGVSSYQASWMPCGDDSSLSDDDFFSDSESTEMNFLPEDSSAVEGLNTVDTDDDKTSRVQEEEDDIEFPDEVDIPVNNNARNRFARYRGLKSFRTSPWDPKESLPSEYSRLFQFENFSNTQRAVSKEIDIIEKKMNAKTFQQFGGKGIQEIEAPGDAGYDTTGYVEAGTYVTIFVTKVSMDAFEKRNVSLPIIASSILKHENKLSLLNFNIQRHASCSDTVKSKDTLEFHCGFQRFSGCPIFSEQNLSGSKHKFQRFLARTGWSVASVYGPSTFQPANVLILKEVENKPSLVATGTFQGVNPDRIVLKRIVLTGVPVKVKRRRAVVRYMFRDPADIMWFKPIELVTKHGLTGHIKESLGTHGDFKAIFNKPVQQHDTICINLYKRVFPKLI